MTFGAKMTLGITKSDHSPSFVAGSLEETQQQRHWRKHSNNVVFISVLKNISDRYKQSNPFL